MAGIDDKALQDYWMWVDASNPGHCDFCDEDRLKTRVIDGNRICKDCNDDLPGTSPHS